MASAPSACTRQLNWPGMTLSPGCQGIIGMSYPSTCAASANRWGSATASSRNSGCSWASRMVHSGPMPAGSPGVRASTGVSGFTSYPAWISGMISVQRPRIVQEGNLISTNASSRNCCRKRSISMSIFCCLRLARAALRKESSVTSFSRIASSSMMCQPFSV